MKRIALTLAGLLVAGASFAQTFEFRQPIKGLSATKEASEQPSSIGPIDCSGRDCYALVGKDLFAVGANNTDQWEPLVLPGNGEVTAFAASGNNLLIVQDNTLYLRGNTSVLHANDDQNAHGWRSISLPGNGPITHIAFHQSALVIRGGEMFGAGHQSRLGIGQSANATNYWRQSFLPGTGDVTHLVMGGSQSYLVQGGVLYATGSNANGQIGRGSTSNGFYSWTESFLPGSGPITDLQSGSQFAMALRGGNIYAVGQNNRGQLGLGDTSNRNEWATVNIPGPGPATQIALGDNHSYLVKNGHVYAAGRNAENQLGYPRVNLSEPEFTITLPSNVDPIERIVGFHNNGFVIRGDSTYVAGAVPAALRGTALEADENWRQHSNPFAPNQD